MSGIVLLTGGHSDRSLCYAMPVGGDWRTDMCQATATRYVCVVESDGTFTSTTLTAVCDPHFELVKRMDGYRWSSEYRICECCQQLPATTTVTFEGGVEFRMCGMCRGQAVA